jgi:hypothetical protein
LFKCHHEKRIAYGNMVVKYFLIALPSALTLALMGRCHRPATSTPCGVGCRSRGVLRRLGSGAPRRRDHARAAATSDLQVAAFRTQIVLCAVHFSWPERHRWYFAL